MIEIGKNGKEEHQKHYPYVTLWIEEGILCCRYADGLHVSLEVARSCVEARIFFSKGKGYPLLVDMKGIKSTTKEARIYLETIGTTLLKTAALITRSPSIESWETFSLELTDHLFIPNCLPTR